MFVVTNLMYNPPGNHLNTLRRPGQVSTLMAIKVERTDFSTGDADPGVAAFFDTIGTAGSVLDTTPLTAPPRRKASVGYRTLLYKDKLNKVCERVAITINTGVFCITPYEILSYTLIWEPDGGA